MSKDFDIYYYDTFMSEYDAYNPRFVLNDSKNRYALYDVCMGKSIPNDICEKLMNIDAIRMENGKCVVNFPLFLKANTDCLQRLSCKAATLILDGLKREWGKLCDCVSLIDNGFSVPYNMYHILCGYYFDGACFDYLEQMKAVSVSQLHKGDRDYIIVGYEKCIELQQFNDNLLCSYNNYSTSNYRFSSFGNANGNRYDIFRYLRLKESNQLSSLYDDIPIYIRNYKEAEFSDLLNSFKENSKGKELLEVFGYMKDGTLCVPVFKKEDQEIINHFSDKVTQLLGVIILNALDMMYEDVLQECSQLIGVEKGIVTNELWHMVFGTVNFMLVDKGMVAMPYESAEEGSYLKCIWEL